MSKLTMADTFERCSESSQCETRMRCLNCKRPVCYVHIERHECQSTQEARSVTIKTVAAFIYGLVEWRKDKPWDEFADDFSVSDTERAYEKGKKLMRRLYGKR